MGSPVMRVRCDLHIQGAVHEFLDLYKHSLKLSYERRIGRHRSFPLPQFLQLLYHAAVDVYAMVGTLPQMKLVDFCVCRSSFHVGFCIDEGIIVLHERHDFRGKQSIQQRLSFSPHNWVLKDDFYFLKTRHCPVRHLHSRCRAGQDPRSMRREFVRSDWRHRGT